MDHVIAVLFFVLGSAVGSFLNVCIDRLPRYQSIVKPPSHCESCDHKLGIVDLIPLISYVALRGRCRYCKARIPYTILIVEMATGLLYMLLWYYHLNAGLSVELALGLIYTSFFVVIFVIDLRHYLVLNRVIYPALGIALVAELVTHFSKVTVPFYGLTVPLYGFLVGAGLLFIVALIWRGGMGMGDVKLGAFIGVIVGYPLAFVCLLISVIAGGVFATGLLLAKRKGRKESIPFAPFLVAGGIITMLYGREVLDFMLNGWYVF
jgi:leader peptidase (prepilin peptidase)/N-methyltransferase